MEQIELNQESDVQTDVQEKPQKELVKKYFQICFNITEGREFTESEFERFEKGLGVQQTYPRSIEVSAYNAKQVREKAFSTIVDSLKHFDSVSKIAITQIAQTDLSKFYSKEQLKRIVDLTK